MAYSKAQVSTALFLCLNILFFTMGVTPINTLKPKVCVDVLDGLVHLVVGVPPKEHYCSLINGLVHSYAAVCLCTALKANVLGINLNVPVDLSLLLNYCGKGIPSGFQCA